MIIMVEWTPKLVTIYKNVVKNADFCQELTLFAAVKQRAFHDNCISISFRNLV